MQKPVAVILLNWNTPAYTLNCIASLQQFCDTALFDVIVADNGSTDGSLTIIKEAYPNLIYIDNKINLGFAAGNNRALSYAVNKGYQYSLLLNTDTEVDEDIILKLSEHLNNHAQACAVQPAIYWLHNKNQIWNGEGRFNLLLGVTKTITKLPATNTIEPYVKADWLTGCCMLIRNSVLQQSGLLNERFFLYYEDVDLSFRMRQTGYELHYLPSCKMYHEAGASARAKPVKKEGALNPVIHYYIVRNHLWILRQYGQPLFYPFYAFYNGPYYAAFLVYFLVRNRKEKFRQLLKGIKEGLFTAKQTIWH